MRHVLVYTECWGRGGIESYLMNVFRLLKTQGFDFTLFSTWDCNMAFDSELRDLGIERKAVFSGVCPSQIKRIAAGTAAFDSILRLHSFDCVYINTMNGLGFLYSQLAKRNNVPVRVVHSHNSQLGPGNGFSKQLGHMIGRFCFGASATRRLACSNEAGSHLFGKNDFEVVNNGIDIDKFSFSMSARNALRDKLAIPADSIVFGSIGRIAPAKDPLRQLRIFREILSMEPKAFYLMVGEGELRNEAENFARMLHIDTKVCFTGYVRDTSPFYSALDVFLMPSLFEGLPLACVEAQCSGCPVVGSDTLPPEAQITELLVSVDHSASDRIWAKASLNSEFDPANRVAFASRIACAGFSLKELGKRLNEVFELKES